MSNFRTPPPERLGVTPESTVGAPQGAYGSGWRPFFALGVLVLLTSCNNDGVGSGDDDACPGCPATCSDGVLNGEEEETDCGGPCWGCDGSRPPQGPAPIREYFSEFMMPVERDECTTLHRPQAQRRWSIFQAGRCAGCGVPSRMSSAAFGDTLIVSWVGAANYTGTGAEEPQRMAYGHLSTFTFTEDAGFQQINDFHYEGCNFDMGSVAVSEDGGVIGALCLARDDALIGDYLNEEPADPELADNQMDMYLFEWTGGEITQQPDTIVRLSQRAGGWNYGHWDLSLSNDLAHYFVEQKATGGGHETELHYAIDRMDGYAKVAGRWTDGSNCGGGHTISNRITRNAQADSWSVFCSLDNRRMRWHPVPNQNYVSTVDRPDLGIEQGDRVSIVTIGQFSTWGEIGVAAGGVANMISLGGDGWLAAGLGPFDIFDGTSQRNERPERLVDQQIGFRRLPLTIEEFVENEGDYEWNWVDQDDLCAPTRGRDPRVGMAQIHNWGLGGEDSGRVLLGYSPAVTHPGRTNEYHVVEVDPAGTPLHDPVLLQRGGWGVDSLGTYMPGSGCVVFPHTWIDDTEEHPVSYPQHQHALTDRSQYLKLTALCPSGSEPRRSPGECRTQLSELHESAPSISTDHVAECPSPTGM
ncbi:MAG: hypothetical protein AB8I08_20915 [Sandaracinaceae bacterium]